MTKYYTPPVRPLGYTRDSTGNVLSRRDTNGTGYDYTHPAPFAPLREEDITKEMLNEYDRLCYADATPKQHLAAVINAFIGVKK
jgi:hypothetical protein